MNMLKAYTKQKGLSLGLSVFPLTEKDNPQTGHSVSFAAQLPDIDLPLHFLDLFLTAILQRQDLADKRTNKDVLAGFLRSGVASQVTHARLASA